MRKIALMLAVLAVTLLATGTASARHARPCYGYGYGHHGYHHGRQFTPRSYHYAPYHFSPRVYYGGHYGHHQHQHGQLHIGGPHYRFSFGF